MISFSKEYESFLKRRKDIDFSYEKIVNEFSEFKLFGEKVNADNPIEMSVLLYYLLKDYELYHERI